MFSSKVILQFGNNRKKSIIIDTTIIYMNNFSHIYPVCPLFLPYVSLEEVAFNALTHSYFKLVS